MLQAKLKINSGSILFYPSLILYFLCFLSLIIHEIWFEGTEKYNGWTIHAFGKSLLTGPSGYCVAVTVNFQLLLLYLFQFPTRASLSEGMIPVLYHDKVPIRTPGETINAVLLSIFLTHQESSAHMLN